MISTPLPCVLGHIKTLRNRPFNVAYLLIFTLNIVHVNYIAAVHSRIFDFMLSFQMYKIPYYIWKAVC